MTHSLSEENVRRIAREEAEKVLHEHLDKEAADAHEYALFDEWRNDPEEKGED